MNRRHEAFAREYIIDNNGTAAAVRAGYSERSAHVTASRLLTNAKVIERVNALTAERDARLERTAVDVVRGFDAIAFSDPADLAILTGVPEIAQLPEDTRRAIASYKVTTRSVRDAATGGMATITTYELRFWDKLRALEALAEYHRLMPKRGGWGSDGGAGADDVYRITMNIPSADGRTLTLERRADELQIAERKSAPAPVEQATSGPRMTVVEILNHADWTDRKSGVRFTPSNARLGTGRAVVPESVAREHYLSREQFRVYEADGVTPLARSKESDTAA